MTIELRPETLAKRFVDVNSASELVAAITEFHSLTQGEKNRFLNYISGAITALRGKPPIVDDLR